MKNQHEGKASPEDLTSLHKWQKRMNVVFVLAMTYLVVLLGLDFFLDFSEKVATVTFAGLVLLAVLGIFTQFSQKCPRCGYRLGFQTRLLTPDACKKCGLGLK